MLTAINPGSPPTTLPRLLRGEDYAPHLYVSVDEDIVATEEDIVSCAFPIDISKPTLWKWMHFNSQQYSPNDSGKFENITRSAKLVGALSSVHLDINAFAFTTH